MTDHAASGQIHTLAPHGDNTQTQPRQAERRRIGWSGGLIETRPSARSLGERTPSKSRPAVTMNGVCQLRPRDAPLCPPSSPPVLPAEGRALPPPPPFPSTLGRPVRATLHLGHTLSCPRPSSGTPRHLPLPSPQRPTWGLALLCTLPRAKRGRASPPSLAGCDLGGSGEAGARGKAPPRAAQPPAATQERARRRPTPAPAAAAAPAAFSGARAVLRRPRSRSLPGATSPGARFSGGTAGPGSDWKRRRTPPGTPHSWLPQRARGWSTPPGSVPSRGTPPRGCRTKSGVPQHPGSRSPGSTTF